MYATGALAKTSKPDSRAFTRSRLSCPVPRAPAPVSRIPAPVSRARPFPHVNVRVGACVERNRFAVAVAVPAACG